MKPPATIFWIGSGKVAWKDKNLDYEIETRANVVEITTSAAWKDKNLDYEIETRAKDS